MLSDSMRPCNRLSTACYVLCHVVCVTAISCEESSTALIQIGGVWGNLGLPELCERYLEGRKGTGSCWGGGVTSC